MNLDAITLTKIVAIVYATMIYAYSGLLIAFYCDKYLFFNFDDKKDNEINMKTTFRHFTELSIIVGLFSVFAYLTRNIIQLIPFPLDQYANFEYMKVSEVKSGAILLWIIFNFSMVLQRKISILRYRFMGL